MQAVVLAPATSRGVAPLFERVGLGLFFLLLFVPTTYTGVKAGLMVVTLAAIGISALRRDRLAVHPAVAAWTLFAVTIGLFFMCRGLMRDAPGATRVGTVFAAWPVVHLLFLHGLAEREMLWRVVRLMFAATLAIAAYAVSYVLHTLGVLPAALYLPIQQGQAIGLHEGYVEINLFSLASLLFLVPFALACVLVWPRGARIPASRTCAWVAVLTGLAVILISGRRALLLVVALSPVFILGLRMLQPRTARRLSRPLILRATALLGGVLVAMGWYLASLGVTPDTLLDMFLAGFDFDRNVDASPRRLQYLALLSGWTENPLLGAGHGASAAGVVRSAEMPWAYELSYVALLFHTGLVGFLAYAAGVVWILWRLGRLIAAGGELGLLALPLAVGMLCFLVGNATNPYLAKFDYMWVIFLPLALVNHALLAGARAARATPEGAA